MQHWQQHYWFCWHEELLEQPEITALVLLNMYTIEIPKHVYIILIRRRYNGIFSFFFIYSNGFVKVACNRFVVILLRSQQSRKSIYTWTRSTRWLLLWNTPTLQKENGVIVCRRLICTWDIVWVDYTLEAKPPVPRFEKEDAWASKPNWPT
jgi:hypothetical protein